MKGIQVSSHRHAGVRVHTHTLASVNVDVVFGFFIGWCA